MDAVTRVNLHCHSLFSHDGALTPEALADNLAAAGVRYAALTDHDTLEGLPRFQEALKRRGIGYIPGVEITARCDGREMHLLGLGFDADHSELKATLLSLRQARDSGLHSIAGALRNAGTHPPDNDDDDPPASNAAPDGQLDIGAAIDLVHRAGGRAFLAHPFTHEASAGALDTLLPQLKALGLDGIEAIYEPFTEAQRAALVDLARRHNLLVSAGTDVHAAGAAGRPVYGIDMPVGL